MKEKTIIVRNKFPVINLTAASMVFPDVISQVFLRSPSGQQILKDAMEGKCPFIFAVMSKSNAKDIPDRSYNVGVVASLEVVPEDLSVLLRGLYRAMVLGWEKNINSDDEESYWLAQVERFEDGREEYFIDKNGELVAHPNYTLSFKTVFSKLKQLLQTFIETSDKNDAEGIGVILDNFENYDLNSKLAMDQLIWALLSVIPEATFSEKQAVLINISILERIKAVVKLLSESLTILRMNNELDDAQQKLLMSGKSKPGNTKNDDFIRGASPEITEKYKKFVEIRDSIINEKEKAIFEEAAMSDFSRLKSFGRASGDKTEVAMISNHLDFILALPWGKESPRKENFKEFERIFESEHCGLEKVKDEISDHVAVRRKHPEGKGRVLCFVGPPGVGKTSVCKSIAHGQGLEYVRISLGGIRDEAEIRGHRRTYIGALPGRIMAGLKSAGVKNTVFVLDEIDKLGNDFRGDPSAALLEVLDPEQNHSFSDHYVEAPFDLSKVFFICTANTIFGIPSALRDRMDIIHFSGYTEEEKVQIAKNFLVPKVLAETGLAQEGFELKWENNNPDEVLLNIIKGYTREAGVRDIERKLSKIARKIVKEDLKEPGYASKVIVTTELVEKIHGRPRVSGRANKTVVGEAIGLVVDGVGSGDVTYVQAKLSLKTGVEKSISQTDEAGAALHKSTQRAVTVVKGKLEEDNPKVINKLQTHLINIQVSDSFAPTDGPSAGITVAVAIYSELTRQLVKPYVAMTGAIALTGRVRAVGGIKEKVIAAANAGVKEVILPESNKKDYDEDVPKSAKEKLEQVYFVEDIDQVLQIVGLVTPKSPPTI